MTIVIDGEHGIMGRVASFAAKEALKGEDVVIVNCDKVIITGGRLNILKEFEATKLRVGSTQKGPKISRTPEKIVKKTVRGMLPNYRAGRGKIAFARVMCYNKVPAEYEKVKKIKFEKPTITKFINVERILRNQRWKTK